MLYEVITSPEKSDFLEVEQAMPVEPGLEAARHDKGRGVGFDDRRAGDAVAGQQFFHLVELGIYPSLVTVELAVAELGFLGLGRADLGSLRDLRLRDWHGAAHDRAGARIAKFGRARRGSYHFV